MPSDERGESLEHLLRGIRLAELTLPFEGLPDGWVAAFTVALPCPGHVLLDGSALRARPESPPPARAGAACDGSDAFEWVFIVAAPDEEITIRDSVQRLLAMPLARRRIVVVDDGSEDRTPEMLRELEHPDLQVLRRDPPDARKGKAAALNHAYAASTACLKKPTAIG